MRSQGNARELALRKGAGRVRDAGRTQARMGKEQQQGWQMGGLKDGRTELGPRRLTRVKAPPWRRVPQEGSKGRV